MSYFVDLSNYTYSKKFTLPDTFNVGWLDNKHIFPTGEAPRNFIDYLFGICCSPVAQTRGYHPCPFCKEYPIKAEPKNKASLFLGSAEIRVEGENAIYMSPNLVYHYIVAHKYLPPTDFVDAVIRFGSKKLSNLS